MKLRLLRNARIATGLPQDPWAKELATADGRIIALDQEAEPWGEMPGAVIEDMEGDLIIPGITDAHLHLMWYALGLRELDLRDLSRAETLERVAQRADELPQAAWITGRGWDQNIWDDTRFPTAA